jgi:hypothetical protein
LHFETGGWVGGSKHLCSTCKQEKDSLKNKWKQTKNPDDFNTYKQKHCYFRSYDKGVTRQYEIHLPFVAMQLDTFFLHKTAFSSSILSLTQLLLPRGVSPQLLADSLQAIRELHRDRLCVAHYTFLQTASSVKAKQRTLTSMVSLVNPD